MHKIIAGRMKLRSVTGILYNLMILLIKRFDGIVVRPVVLCGTGLLKDKMSIDECSGEYNAKMMCRCTKIDKKR